MRKENEKRNEIKSYLKTMFPNASCELKYNSPFELLVAVILSAQCTDKRVNMVTSEIFKKYNEPKDFAKIEIELLEQLIKPCGFYKNKAKAIKQTSVDIIQKFDGQVPMDREKLMTLRGVGRKTANVVLSELTDFPAIAVDTHVFRVSNRLGISSSTNVSKCEKDLMEYFNESDWSKMHYLLVLFGRYHCKAIKPKCDICNLKNVCKYYKRNKKEII